jgi:hypothetical protein
MLTLPSPFLNLPPLWTSQYYSFLSSSVFSDYKFFLSLKGSCSLVLGWLIVCGNLTGPQGTQIFGQILFWVCLWGCFWMRWTFELVDWGLLSPVWVGITQSVARGWVEPKAD